ncbi:TonB-dependent receptor domain-containing protein [Novosphingobium resinovorum]|uniref:TonB-dependent receptor domain-containing protein n=1 Tax=Novosphingobium resinovorum TaxID=158500 RepID=UPI002ED0227C|nr:TonB-dependent receptor [Novosphingobium resinovorum]
MSTVRSGVQIISSKSQGRVLAVSLLASVAAAGLIAPAAALAQSGNEAGTIDFNIPPRPLSEALADFGRQSGVQINVDADDIRGRSSPGVSGRMSNAQALNRMLAETGLTWQIDNGFVTLVPVPRTAQASDDAKSNVQLGPLRVDGAQTGNLAAAQETGVERDARRKDEIYDQDISSTFASREEIERYRGTNTADVLKGMVNVFSGDSRNGGAIDPSIRGIQGPGRIPVIIDGTEQALTVWKGYNGAGNRSYIDPSLISGMQVLKGPVSARGVNGSTGGAVVVNTLDAADILKPGQTFGIELKLEGGNNSTNPRWPTLLTGLDHRTVPGFPTGFSASYPYSDPSLRVTLRTKDDNEAFSAGDRAIRIAAAGRVGDFELFGAYAFRERGNYFSGKHDADYYQQEGLVLNAANYVRLLGLHYEPGNEVPNTSSELESVMLKAQWNIADDQALQIGFRDTRSNFGEIMPSRIMTTGDGYTFGNIQWPESKVHAQALNAEYKWRPDSRFIDFKATAWLTDTVSDTYSGGGFPNVASATSPIIVNSAIANSHNDRFGFSASNQFNLSSRLSFLLDANWQHEKLRSDDDFAVTSTYPGVRAYPREGRREEYRINLSGEWKPVKFLKLNAGIAYTGYWAKDDFLPKLIEASGGSITQSYAFKSETSYQTTEFGAEAYEAWLRERLPTASDAVIQRRIATYLRNPVPFEWEHAGPDWVPDADGKYHRADNICINGFLDTIANSNGVCTAGGVNTLVSITEAKRKSGHGWVPSASATVYISDSSRAYLRYAEALRWPSMFESTIGFSASIDPVRDLKPERMKSWEAAFIQDLRPLFGLRGEGHRADVKLTWYHNTTHDVIERTSNLLFSNLDKQTIAGFEFQARFDNGRFFTDISAGHMTKNEVCDESTAVSIDTARGYRVPDCVKYGFVSSFLLTQATPETSVNWNVGGRFFDRRLEVGGRLIWYSAYENSDPIGEWTTGETCVGGCSLNIPYTWGEIITFDAYARFRINERFNVELAGTNLNDRYYMDPLSRSMLPAPGRTVRLSLTGRF